MESYEHVCNCGESIDPRRYSAGYTCCLTCGEREARNVKHCIVPMHKSNYTVVTDKSLLFQLNKSGR